MAAQAPEDPIVKALQEYTTCDVADALVKLKQSHGGFLPGLILWSPQRQEGSTKIVGPAYTVQYAAKDDPRPKWPSHYVFARDVGTTPPGPLFKVVAVNEPVKFSNDGRDIIINPGDYLIGDVNGVVVLPMEIAEQALPLMAKQVDADSKMAVEIKKGMTFTEASKRFRL
ncbi:hypothetical protein N0V88_004230 [Collariella sp. IMI 366227]|nr:hypothetical protein N0V88_004230 [Collariella sp. IMI 366227]